PWWTNAGHAGDVVAPRPGPYVATFRGPDNSGSTSQPATRTVTVSDFSIGASPSSQTVAPGAGTSYTATIAAINGFAGAVSFGAAGLPAGASARVDPPPPEGSRRPARRVTTEPRRRPGGDAAWQR